MKIRNIFRPTGLIFVLICLVHQFTGDKFPATVEVKVNPSGETSIIWDDRFGIGRYFIYLRYDSESLPSEVKNNLFDEQHIPQLNWMATLTVSSNHIPLLSEKSLHLEPAAFSEQKQYFLVGQYELENPALIEINLTPKEPPLFGGIIPFLSVYPDPLYIKSLYMRMFLWRVGNYICAFVVILLLLDFLVLRRTRHANQRK